MKNSISYLIRGLLIFLIFFILSCYKITKVTKPSFVLINLGDSLTNGTQSGLQNVHEHTQKNGFANLLADKLLEISNLKWNNPYLIKNNNEKRRINPKIIPYNLGVDKFSIKEMIKQKTNGENQLLTELLKPIPDLIGHDLSQLEAALYLAKINPKETKIFTLWIGCNDVIWAVIEDYGTKITRKNIVKYLNNTEAEHDILSIKKNLNNTIKKLVQVKKSHIFIATIPYMSRPSFFFYKKDIERLAQFSRANVYALPKGESIGIGPFLKLAAGGMLNKESSNELLNTAIDQMVKADIYTMSAYERKLIDDRVDEINAIIKSMAIYENVTVVDCNLVFEAGYDGKIEVKGHQLVRTFGGGLFSLDAFHPTNTFHAILANEYIKAINETLNLTISFVDIEDVWEKDPYQDKDRDGFIPGPGNGVVGSEISNLGFTDCNDSNPSIIAPFISGIPCNIK